MIALVVISGKGLLDGLHVMGQGSEHFLVAGNGVEGDESPVIIPGLHAFADLIVGNIGG